MPPSATLQDAASNAYDDMFVWWQIGQLKLRYAQFIGSALPFFNVTVPTDRTVANWFVPIQALNDQMAAGVVPLVQFNEAVQSIYRICWQGSSMRTATLITAPQAAGLLAAYNGAFS
jgi:hypothetical protein